MPPPARRVSRFRGGWSLLELLLSVAIALLVTALLASVFHVALSTTRGQEARRSRRDASRALAQMSLDLQAAFYPEANADCELKLANGDQPDDGFRLTFCATEAHAGEGEPGGYRVIRVQYEMVTNALGPALIRSASPLVGPGAFQTAVTHRLVNRVRQASFHLFDGAEWVDAWPISDQRVVPKAARLKLSVGDGAGSAEFETEVFLPSSAVVRPARTSGLLRRSSSR